MLCHYLSIYIYIYLVVFIYPHRAHPLDSLERAPHAQLSRGGLSAAPGAVPCLLLGPHGARPCVPSLRRRTSLSSTMFNLPRTIGNQWWNLPRKLGRAEAQKWPYPKSGSFAEAFWVDWFPQVSPPLFSRQGPDGLASQDMCFVISQDDSDGP